jgi:hypothetical protein
MTAEILDARNVCKDGTWFRDGAGRYLLFRGVNFASRSKLPPYLPVFPLHNKNASLDVLKKELLQMSSALEGLKKLGFNVVRFIVMWKALEPFPNPALDSLLPEGEKYLAMVREIIDVLYNLGIYTIIDFHQDIAHEAYGGDGFPDWALAIDEKHPLPIKAGHINQLWFLGYNVDPLVRNTLLSFWKNQLTNTQAGLHNYPVRTHLEKTIGQTVKFFKNINSGHGHKGILGYQLFNEPHPVGLDRQNFEKEYLANFYSNTLQEIKRFDNRVFILIEPRVDWTIFPDIEIASIFLQEIKGKESVKMSELSNLIQTLIRNNKGIGFLEIANLLIAQIGNVNGTNILKLREQLNEILNVTSKITTYLPNDAEFINQFKESGILSFHYYDPWTLFYSLLNFPDNMHNKLGEWSTLFNQMREAAVSRSLVPFLTEFGGNQDWERLNTDLQPQQVYQGKQIRAYMNLQFMLIENFLLNSTYWNYDLYNTQQGKDNWNFENFSLLGPNNESRNLDIVSRPYPLKSSAKPELLFFDLGTKQCSLVLNGPVVDAPTVMFIPYESHYSPEFKVWSTSNNLEWNKDNQLLNWLPDKNLQVNQVIISPKEKLDTSVLPSKSNALLEKTKYSNMFS